MYIFAWFLKPYLDVTVVCLLLLFTCTVQRRIHDSWRANLLQITLFVFENPKLIVYCLIIIYPFHNVFIRSLEQTMPSWMI